ncbi:ABC transporter permease [Tabrizicola soli]|uniref:ABC transporter permease n=1 Tax=Tabrizicola soli TaxID=2185115 RepID=A0ABV7DT46_9RHOB
MTGSDEREVALLKAFNEKQRGRASRIAYNAGFWYALTGVVGFLLLWHITTDVLTLPRFNFLPTPLDIFTEWTSTEPKYGVSLFTPIYYEHILVSVRRVMLAFFIAVAAGVPLGILLGWSRTFYNFVFPIVELLRPIPPLAWVPFAVLILPGVEASVVLVTLLAAFFATVLNTLLGVWSINDDYFRAAHCLGYRRIDVLTRIIIPGAMPFVFTGLQIAMGVAWFSLVGGEMIAGRSGLGFLIFDAYMQVALPNIVIGMITLGVLGYLSSAAIRRVGSWLMAWQEKGRAGQ